MKDLGCFRILRLGITGKLGSYLKLLMVSFMVALGVLKVIVDLFKVWEGMKVIVVVLKVSREF